jgi:hypothetical protein
LSCQHEQQDHFSNEEVSGDEESGASAKEGEEQSGGKNQRNQEGDSEKESNGNEQQQPHNKNDLLQSRGRANLHAFTEKGISGEDKKARLLAPAAAVCGNRVCSCALPLLWVPTKPEKNKALRDLACFDPECWLSDNQHLQLVPSFGLFFWIGPALQAMHCVLPQRMHPSL